MVIVYLLEIFFTALFATFISSMSGGGASIIAIPIFLSMGISFPLATTIQQISSTFWVLPAARNYLKDKRIDWIFLSLFSLIGLIGVIIGIIFLLSISQRNLEIIIGTIIVLLVIYIFFRKDFGLVKIKIGSYWRRILAYPFALIMGFYESIFGSGNGLFFSVVSIYTRGFVLKESLGYYYAIAFPWVLLSAILLISKGYYNVSFMIAGVIGAVIGGYFGSKYASYKGNKFIKTIFCIIGLVLGLKLILGF